MNPFKDHGDLLPITSINRLYVDDQKAYDLFHSALIKHALIQAIRPYTNDRLDDLTLSDLIHVAHHLHIDTLSNELETIIQNYGKKLAGIIGTLFKPTELSKKNHHEWKDIHFDYWASIKTLYIAGGAIIDPFIEPFKREVEIELKKRDLEKNVIFLTHSEDLGILGMSSLFTEEGTLLLLDFGQTSIKRAIYKNHDANHKYIPLPSIPAKYLFSSSQHEPDVLDSAQKLHQYIVQSIQEIILEQHIKPNAIYMSVANYVKQGCLQPGKNSYGKLDYLGHPYDLYLQNALEKVMPFRVQVRLFHDTSAMALNYKNQAKTAIISVGTAFGVGFTEE